MVSGGRFYGSIDTTKYSEFFLVTFLDNITSEYDWTESQSILQT